MPVVDMPVSAGEYTEAAEQFKNNEPIDNPHIHDHCQDVRYPITMGLGKELTSQLLVKVGNVADNVIMGAKRAAAAYKGHAVAKVNNLMKKN